MSSLTLPSLSAVSYTVTLPGLIYHHVTYHELHVCTPSDEKEREREIFDRFLMILSLLV